MIRARLISFFCILLLGAGLVSVPALLSGPAGVPHPFSLWPASDAAFDLGIAGPLETNFRWRNVWLASALVVGATNATADTGELVMNTVQSSTQPRSAPGAGNAVLRFETCTAGKCNLVAYGGTDVTPTTVASNIGKNCGR